MKARPCFVMAAVALIVIVTGCSSSHSLRSQPGYREAPDSFVDPQARQSYIDKRVDELTRQGLSRENAVARASDEWFAHAPVAIPTITPKELERRKAQNKFEEDLRQQLADAKR